MPGRAVYHPVRMTFSRVEEADGRTGNRSLGFASNCSEDENAGAFLPGPGNVSNSFTNKT